MSTATVLAQHIDTPTSRHRCVLLDARRLRCLDCAHTLQLPASASTTSTSNSPIPGKDEPRCDKHPTEHAGHCRPCAADHKADETRTHTHTPTADVTTRAAEARAALVRRRT